MAIYKYPQYLEQNNHAAYDQVHHPGTPTPYSGVSGRGRTMRSTGSDVRRVSAGFGAKP